MKMYSATFHCIIAILLVFTITEIYCTGKIYTTDGNKKYYIENGESYTWFDALNGCLKMNMSLVTIETNSKSEEINTLVIKNMGRKYLWIGAIATRHPSDNTFIWLTTGNQITSTFWYDSYPKFSNSYNEYCLLIGFTANMRWANYDCLSKYGYICEEDPQKLKEFKLLKDQQKLKENLSLEIKERENLQNELKKQKLIVDNLKEQLQMIKDQDLNGIKLKRNILENEENLLKQQLQLNKQQQNQTKTLTNETTNQTQTLINQTSNQTKTLINETSKQQELENIVEKKVQEKLFNLMESNDEESKQLRNIIFQFQRNTYIQAYGRQPSTKDNV